MTIRVYAARKGWPVDQVRVSLKHSRIYAEDCVDCETQTGKVDKIDRSLSLFGNLDEAQRMKLLEIADKCPVHRTLEGEIKIGTVLS